ncbi:MAG: transglycosylase domain-containing protein, partial [Pseudomonadales bacterium]|nr:transglycosylase domain-containing protein [Pseudomonadales bacterium]
MKLFMKMIFTLCFFTPIFVISVYLYVTAQYKNDFPPLLATANRKSIDIYTADDIYVGHIGERTQHFKHEVPENIVKAVTLVEDKRFFQHFGVDPLALVRATKDLILNQKIVSGGGTISMQVVRGMLLNREKSVNRKIKEIILSIELERRYSKKEILS